MPNRHPFSSSLVLALALLCAPALADETEPGVWWEQTVEMSMPGMSMPAQKQRVCVSKKGMSEPPGASKDERCKVTDLKQTGAKMTWKMECSEPERMTGEGEITQGNNSYTGQMAMHSRQGDMTMKMKGKLVGGDCDAAAPRKQAAAIQKQAKDNQDQADAAMAQGCDKAADDVQLRMFTGPIGMCKKPDQIAKVCSRLSTRSGYVAFREQGDPEQANFAKDLCKKDPEKIRAALCKEAAGEARGEETPRETLDFLADNCPEETQALAKKVCAGRKFTGLPPKIRDICVKYAREELEKPSGKQEPADEDALKKKNQAADKAKGVLKGLFGN